MRGVEIRDQLAGDELPVVDAAAAYLERYLGYFERTALAGMRVGLYNILVPRVTCS